MAIFVAAILAVIGGITALTIWLVNHNAAGRSAYMIELLADTTVDMDGVTAFGIVESGGAVKNSALYADADEQKNKNSKFDSTLVSFDENGDVSEVVFRYVDGKGVVTQDKIGIANNIYVTTEFTFIEYSTPDDYDKNSTGNHNTPKDIFFRCDHNAQSFAIHNESGRVYSLNDIGDKYIRETFSDYLYVSMQITVLDGALITDINYYDGKNSFYGTMASFKIGIDENANLVASELMPNKSAKVNNIYRDVYGNLYVFNSMFDEKRENVLYISPNSDLKYFYYGSDKKVYLVEENYNNTGAVSGIDIKVFDENLELRDLSAPPDIALSGGRILIINNGYLFAPGNITDVYKYTAGGLFVKLYEESGMSNINESYILGGELTAIVERGSTKKFVHIDLSEFDETDRKVTIKDICDASSVSKPYGIFLKSLIVTKENFDGKQRYQITCENGEIVQTLLSDEKYGGRIISIQPLN